MGGFSSISSFLFFFSFLFIYDLCWELLLGIFRDIGFTCLVLKTFISILSFVLFLFYFVFFCFFFFFGGVVDSNKVPSKNYKIIVKKKKVEKIVGVYE